jgi:phosphotransferase family enzyme
MRQTFPKVTISDAFGAAHDPDLPTLSLALNPEAVDEEFRHGLPRLAGKNARIAVRSITVTRYKPGRRCVIEYHVRIRHADGSREKTKLIGKIRAHRFGNEAYRLLDAIWSSGFNSTSTDGVSVPEPIGVIPRFQMWLQRKIRGATATALLQRPGGVLLARRIAEAIHKLHRISVPINRTHAIADELQILHECLPVVAQQRPALANRINQILTACDRLAATLPESQCCGIHRDFYPAQVIVHHSRLHLIDFDLYCMGDPALDLGNFIGHITEQCLRELGDPKALEDREQAMEERFVELSGKAVRSSVRAYAILTLVRHIYLSTQFADRHPFTERLVELCEERLSALL